MLVGTEYGDAVLFVSTILVMMVVVIVHSSAVNKTYYQPSSHHNAAVEDRKYLGRWFGRWGILASAAFLGFLTGPFLNDGKPLGWIGIGLYAVFAFISTIYVMMARDRVRHYARRRF